MKTRNHLNPKKNWKHLAAFLLLISVTGLSDLTAQWIENDEIRRDVRGTARRTARRVNRRQDIWQASHEAQPYYNNVIYTLPGGCVLRAIAGIDYHYCNGIYYQPKYQGSQVVYIQVDVDD